MLRSDVGARLELERITDYLFIYIYYAILSEGIFIFNCSVLSLKQRSARPAAQRRSRKIIMDGIMYSADQPE